MKRVIFWMFPFVFCYAVTITIFLFWRNPLPFPDYGHRCFAVQDERTAKVVGGILRDFGLPERFTFTAGPTNQTLLWDNTTVLIWHDEKSASLPPNGFSIPTSDPLDSAHRTAFRLENYGYTTTVHDDIMPSEMSDKLVILESDAFDGWVMVFRRHILAMGSPPDKRKLLK